MPRLWAFWPVYLGLLALALGARRAAGAAAGRRWRLGRDAGHALHRRGGGGGAHGRGAVRPADAGDGGGRPLGPAGAAAAAAGPGLAAGSAGLRFRLAPTAARPDRRRARLGALRGAARADGDGGARWSSSGRRRWCPTSARCKAMALRFLTDREFRAGLKIERYKGDGTEFDSLKEHAPGDDRRVDRLEGVGPPPQAGGPPVPGRAQSPGGDRRSTPAA